MSDKEKKHLQPSELSANDTHVLGLLQERQVDVLKAMNQALADAGIRSAQGEPLYVTGYFVGTKPVVTVACCCCSSGIYACPCSLC